MRKRRNRILACGIIIGMLLENYGCAGSVKGNSKKAAETAPSLTVMAEAVPSQTESMTKKRDPDSERKSVELVGIRAHVKETGRETLLVSSDSDDFPGVFTVTGAGEIPEFSDLEGGTSILILMRKSGGEDSRGNANYEAQQIVILTGDEEEGQEDILLTEVPEFTLQDALSGKMESVSLRSGNYTWNAEKNGEGSGTAARGAAPLKEAGMDFTARLRIPEYNGMDGAPYIFSTRISPDILTVRRWNADDMGKDEAGEEMTVKYYYKQPVLILEPGKVYEFAVEWKEENKDKNGFYGRACYVLVTE